ncbi:NFACT family protein [Candidatus Woesearchaeota archaeon]|nr:NFACT family protein [Candidatus Woesearchaeota archaeon]
MKTQLTSVEIHYLVKELDILIDGKIDKIYQPSKEMLLLQFHLPGKGKKILKIPVGKVPYLSEEKEEFGEPPGFCMQLRKHLGNARLRKIEQKESERIIELDFEKKEGIKKLFVELFSKGNVILTDDKNIIIMALQRQEFKDRSIKPKEEYKYPKKQVNFFDLKIEALSELIKNSKKDAIVTCLAVEVGLGGVYGEEVCLLSNIDKNKKPSSINQQQIKSITENIKSITKQKLSPQIVKENEKVKDIVPFKLKLYEKLEQEKATSFNEALKYLEAEPKKAESAYEKQIEKIKRIIERQETQIKGFEESELKQRKNAELIYQNYNLINEVLTEINKATKKHSWDEIKERLKGHKIIKEIDAKEKKIVLELP